EAGATRSAGAGTIIPHAGCRTGVAGGGSVLPHLHHHFAQDPDVVGDDRLVILVFGLEANPPAIAVETLDGGFVLDQGRYDFAVASRLLLADGNQVPVQDSGPYHAVAPDAEHEDLVLIADEV